MLYYPDIYNKKRINNGFLKRKFKYINNRRK